MSRADLITRWRFFMEHAGYCTPPGRVACALALARAEHRAESIGLAFDYQADDVPWDGDGKAPVYNLVCFVYDTRQRDPRDRGLHRCVASVGAVGVDSLADPYLDVVRAELFAEALETLDAESDARASIAADELLSRATFAGGSDAPR